MTWSPRNWQPIPPATPKWAARLEEVRLMRTMIHDKMQRGHIQQARAAARELAAAAREVEEALADI